MVVALDIKMIIYGIRSNGKRSESLRKRKMRRGSYVIGVDELSFSLFSQLRRNNGNRILIMEAKNELMLIVTVNLI